MCPGAARLRALARPETAAGRRLLLVRRHESGRPTACGARHARLGNGMRCAMRYWLRRIWCDVSDLPAAGANVGVVQPDGGFLEAGIMHHAGERVCAELRTGDPADRRRAAAAGDHRRR